MNKSFARQVRALRTASYTRRGSRPSLQMPSQSEFAERFGLSAGAWKDAEQGRGQPSRAMRVLIVAIELDPLLIEKAALLAMDRASRE